MLLPFANPDGSPYAPCLFANAVLTSALYHGDRGAFDAYARLTGTTRELFQNDPTSFDPDVAVLRDAGNALVVFSGTTNQAQWVGHCAGAVFPVPDVHVPLDGPGSPLCVGSFLAGLAIVHRQIEDAVGTRAHVQITGHSYGAGSAHIYARQLANATTRPTSIELLTFGEPKAYDGRHAVSEPDFHARLIARLPNIAIPDLSLGVDPVTLLPPGLLQLGAVGKTVKFLRNLFGFSWAHHGIGWLLNLAEVVRGQDTPFIVGNLPGMQTVLIGSNLVNAFLHLMDQTYLVYSYEAWQRSALEPGLAVLVPYMDLYLRRPFEPAATLRPLTSAATLNRAYFPPGDTPVADADRGDWEQTSAAGSFFPIGGNGGRMSLMRGSMLMGIMQQGFSETWHAIDTSLTFDAMNAKMGQIMPKRFKLSNGVNDKAAANFQPDQLSIVAFRISDDSKARAVYVTKQTAPLGWNSIVGNEDGQVCSKIVWRDSGFSQIAVTYLHGLPADATVPPEEVERNTAFTPAYKAALTQYCNAVAAAGLGFNTLNLTPANAMGAVTAVSYDAVSGRYSITMSGAVPQGQFRVRLTGFKALRVLNGRQSAQSIGASQFVVQKVAANHTWDGFGKALPLSGYNNGVFFSNYVVKAPATAEPTLVTTKKLGRPFFLQHGRVTRRAA